MEFVRGLMVRLVCSSLDVCSLQINMIRKRHRGYIMFMLEFIERKVNILSGMHSNWFTSPSSNIEP